MDDDDDNDDERCGSMHLALRMPAGKGMMLVLDPSRPEPGRCAPGGGKERGARRRAFEVEESATIIGIDQAGQKPRGRAGAGAWWCRACWNSCTGRWINDPVDRPRWLVVVVVVVVVVDGRGGRRGAADDGVDPAGRGRGGGREHGHDTLQVRGGRPGGGDGRTGKRIPPPPPPPESAAVAAVAAAARRRRCCDDGSLGCSSPRNRAP